MGWTDAVGIEEVVRVDGHTVTLVESGGIYWVDMWDASGSNRWHMRFDNRTDAENELKKWRD
jgi:hypothetical protein